MIDTDMTSKKLISSSKSTIITFWNDIVIYFDFSANSPCNNIARRIHPQNFFNASIHDGHVLKFFISRTSFFVIAKDTLKFFKNLGEKFKGNIFSGFSLELSNWYNIIIKM